MWEGLQQREHITPILPQNVLAVLFKYSGWRHKAVWQEDRHTSGLAVGYMGRKVAGGGGGTWPLDLPTKLISISWDTELMVEVNIIFNHHQSRVRRVRIYPVLATAAKNHGFIGSNRRKASLGEKFTEKSITFVKQSSSNTASLCYRFLIQGTFFSALKTVSNIIDFWQ